MKLILFVLGCASLALAEETYSAEADNIDISQILKNDRLLLSYSKCLLDKGPCTPEVKKVKEKIPEALETRCAKCTERQKKMAKTLAKEVKRSHPEIWDKVVLHYDPTGKYQDAFKDWLQD